MKFDRELFEKKWLPLIQSDLERMVNEQRLYGTTITHKVDVAYAMSYIAKDTCNGTNIKPMHDYKLLGMKAEVPFGRGVPDILLIWCNDSYIKNFRNKKFEGIVSELESDSFLKSKVLYESVEIKSFLMYFNPKRDKIFRKNRSFNEALRISFREIEENIGKYYDKNGAPSISSVIMDDEFSKKADFTKVADRIITIPSSVNMINKETTRTFKPLNKNHSKNIEKIINTHEEFLNMDYWVNDYKPLKVYHK